MKTYQEIAAELGELVDRKAAAYGDTILSSEVALGLLYPEGIAPQHFGDVLLIVRIFDKLGRIANDRTAFDESPYLDIAGYALRGVHHHLMRQQMKEQVPTWQGSASGPDAEQQSKAQPASADQPTKARTTTSGNEPSARRHSRRPGHSSAASPTPAPAPTAPEAANPSEADQLVSRSLDVDRAFANRLRLKQDFDLWVERDTQAKCVACSAIHGIMSLPAIRQISSGADYIMHVCSQECWDFGYLLLRDRKVEGAELA